MGSDTKNWNDEIEINLPDGFVVLEPEQGRKYFLGMAPDIIYANESKTAFITLKKTDMDFDSENIDVRLSEYYQLYNRSVANFANAKIVKRKLSNGRPIGVIQYTSTAGKKELFNFFVLLVLHDKEVILTLHGNLKDISRFGIDFINTINSIDIM